MFLSSVVTPVFSALLLAQAAAPNGQPRNAFMDTLPMFVFFGVIFYFVLLRPQQKRAKEQAALLAAMRAGDEVVTSGGFHGIVANPRDADSKTVLVKFAENVKIEVDKSAIATVLKPEGSGAKAVPVSRS